MGGKHILVVDDEPDLVEMLKLQLEAKGYKVTTASDGQEALEKVREIKPDLVLLDIMMPKMDGYQVCRMIKFDDELKHIAVVMLTARVQERDQKTGEEVGADAYLTKPFEYRDLLAKVAELLP